MKAESSNVGEFPQQEERLEQEQTQPLDGRKPRMAYTVNRKLAAIASMTSMGTKCLKQRGTVAYHVLYMGP